MNQPKYEIGDRDRLLKAIDRAEKELLELEQEYQEDLLEAEICDSQHPRFTKSNSIRLAEWRIEKLFNQLRQLDEPTEI